MSSLPPSPKVSVSIITYNHEAYIARTLDSVLQQEVSFSYEIIVGEDCSSDNTRAILLEYQRRYPDIIQLVLHPTRYEGVAGRLNNITNLYACRGQYIAMLDGDDYWISTDKLQKQVDFLDAHPDYVMSFHDTLFVADDAAFAPYYHSDTNERLAPNATYTYQDIADGWFVQTSTLLFRNGLIGEFPEWFWHIYSADYAIQLLIAQHGKVKYQEDIKGARLISPNSFSVVYNTTLADNQLRIDELKIFRQHFPNLAVDVLLGKFYFRRALLFKKQKHYPKALLYLTKAVLKDYSIAEMLGKKIIRKGHAKPPSRSENP